MGSIRLMASLRSAFFLKVAKNVSKIITFGHPSPHSVASSLRSGAQALGAVLVVPGGVTQNRESVGNDVTADDTPLLLVWWNVLMNGGVQIANGVGCIEVAADDSLILVAAHDTANCGETLVDT